MNIDNISFKLLIIFYVIGFLMMTISVINAIIKIDSELYHKINNAVFLSAALLCLFRLIFILKW